MRRGVRAALGCLLGLLIGTLAAPRAWADAGELDLVVLGSGGFSGNSNPYNNGYYTTGLSSYAFTANLGYWFDDSWEAGVGAGPGRTQYQSCNSQNVCANATQATVQFTVFGRYNFTSDYGAQYSFTGLQVNQINAGRALGSVTVLHPVAGYRFSLMENWSLELSVGAGIPVAGDTARFPVTYDVQMGLVIPL
ncbi:MAG TPA: hypothetical protein VJR90_08180 [Gammaproteobacteria bacterium]|nr:hypothetical protein [Gammaproteobacteria bacterium]HKV97447.1 hypothetical protein [Gammaproteobacteria bacterium]